MGDGCTITPVSVPQAEYQRALEKEAAARASVPQGRVTSVLTGRCGGDCLPLRAGGHLQADVLLGAMRVAEMTEGADRDPDLGRM